MSFDASPAGAVAGVLFTGLLAAACVCDLRTRRIPNALVLALGIAGIGFSVTTGPATAGLGRALEGMLTGLAVWLPFWLLRKIGAGDVKLFAAAGAWLGPGAAVTAALLAALLGGVLTIAWLVGEQGLVPTARALWLRLAAVQARGTTTDLLTVPRRRRVPYGLALAAGALLVAWLPELAS